MSYFNTPPLDGIMKESHFFHWLKKTYTYGDKLVTIDAQCDYLESLGFVVGQDKADPEFFKLSSYIVADFARWLCPGGEQVFKLSDLVSPATEKSRDSFSLWGVESFNKVFLKATLKKLIIKADPIYREISPDNYFFEVVNNNLYIKYQQIIGSRKLCKVGL